MKTGSLEEVGWEVSHMEVVDYKWCVPDVFDFRTVHLESMLVCGNAFKVTLKKVFA